MIPGHQNAEIEHDLSTLPDLVADALQAWRIATLEREKIEGLLYLQFKGGEEKRTTDELKALVRSDGGRYMAVLAELKAEANYTRLLEKLYSSKKAASLRTAF